MKYTIIFLFLTLIYGINIDNNTIYNKIKLKYGLKSHNYYMVEANLHIVGFSKNNLVEYVLQRPNEVSDKNSAIIFVQNIVTDKIVYRSNRLYFKKSFKDMLKKYKKEIDKVADNFDIFKCNYKLKEFPSIIGYCFKINI